MRIPSPGGGSVFHFNRNGKHLRTVDARTGATLLEFRYEVGGRLMQVLDADGRAHPPMTSP